MCHLWWDDECGLLKYRAVILVPPDEDLCDGTYRFHQEVAVVVCHCSVFGQDVVHVPEGNIIYIQYE